MKNRSNLGKVNSLAGEHRLSCRLHLPRPREVEEELEHLLVDPVLGEVDQNVAILRRWQHLAENTYTNFKGLKMSAYHSKCL